MSYIITFPNTHMAIYGEKALLQAGFSVGVMPVPASIKAGCGIALRVNDYLKAQEQLAESNIAFSEIYEAEQSEGKTHYKQII